MLMQQNVDGSDFFNRSWAEFKVGFNSSRGDKWLTQLTLNGRYKLGFDLQSRASRNWYYAEYSAFVVQGEQTNYTLHASGYSGNAGKDSFSGMMFCTHDRDNDLYSSVNCAAITGGGFWHKTCGWSEVNSMDLEQMTSRGMDCQEAANCSHVPCRLCQWLRWTWDWIVNDRMAQIFCQGLSWSCVGPMHVSFHVSTISALSSRTVVYNMLRPKWTYCFSLWLVLIQIMILIINLND